MGAASALRTGRRRVRPPAAHPREALNEQGTRSWGVFLNCLPVDEMTSTPRPCMVGKQDSKSVRCASIHELHLLETRTLPSIQASAVTSCAHVPHRRLKSPEMHPRGAPTQAPAQVPFGAGQRRRPVGVARGAQLRAQAHQRVHLLARSGTGLAHLCVGLGGTRHGPHLRTLALGRVGPGRGVGDIAYAHAHTRLAASV